MALEVPHLRRGLFGYRRDEVDGVLAHRDEEVHRLVAERNQIALRLDEASTSLLSARRDLTEVEERLATATAWTTHLETGLEIGNARVSELERENGDLATRLAGERSRADGAEGRLRAVETELHAERERADVAATQLAEAVERATASAATAEARARELEETARTLTQVRSELERAHVDLRTERADAERTRHDLAAARAAGEGTRAEAEALRRRVGELEEERDEARRDAEVAAQVGTQVDEAPLTAPGVSTPSEAPPIGAEDVAVALGYAERAMERIVAENRRRLEDEISRLEQRRDAFRDEVDRLEARADRLRGAGSQVGNAVRETRDAIHHVDEAIRTALEPLVGSLSILDEGIGVLDVVRLHDDVEDEEPHDERGQQIAPPVPWFTRRSTG